MSLARPPLRQRPRRPFEWPCFYAFNVSGLLGSLGLVPNPGLDAGSDSVSDIEREFLETCARKLTDDLVYGLFGSSAVLQESPVGEYVSADAPSTDDLHFDSPTGLVVHHARPDESRVRLRTAGGEGGRDREAASQTRVHRPTARLLTGDPRSR